MFVLKLIARNALRHKLRTVLTVTGLVVAVLAYGLLQTVVDAWYAGARRPPAGGSSHATRSRSCSRCRSATKAASAAWTA